MFFTINDLKSMGMMFKQPDIFHQEAEGKMNITYDGWSQFHNFQSGSRFYLCETGSGFFQTFPSPDLIYFESGSGLYQGSQVLHVRVRILSDFELN